MCALQDAVVTTAYNEYSYDVLGIEHGVSLDSEMNGAFTSSKPAKKEDTKAKDSSKGVNNKAKEASKGVNKVSSQKVKEKEPQKQKPAAAPMIFTPEEKDHDAEKGHDVSIWLKQPNETEEEKSARKKAWGLKPQTLSGRYNLRSQNADSFNDLDKKRDHSPHNSGDEAGENDDEMRPFKRQKKSITFAPILMSNDKNVTEKIDKPMIGNQTGLAPDSASKEPLSGQEREKNPQIQGMGDSKLGNVGKDASSKRQRADEAEFEEGEIVLEEKDIAGGEKPKRDNNMDEVKEISKAPVENITPVQNDLTDIKSYRKSMSMGRKESSKAKTKMDTKPFSKAAHLKAKKSNASVLTYAKYYR